jgi:hypothetical protein
MSNQKSKQKSIRLTLLNANGAVSDDHATLDTHFATVAGALDSATRHRTGDLGGRNDPISLMAIAGDFLRLMRNLDSQYGADAELPFSDTDAAADEALQCLTEIESWLDRLDIAAQRGHLHALQIGIGYWAMRHGLPLQAAAPIVNALAAQSNEASTRQDTAAVFALMQGFIAHFALSLSADLERSNPERPWRLLNLNFAITAIRTGDAAMMRFAFDTLNANLPQECAGFYADAVALASRPGFPSETMAIIAVENAKWTPGH